MLEITARQPQPPTASPNSDALLSIAADSTCKQLTAAGMGGVKHQPAFAPAEFRQLVQAVKQLPPSSLRHTARKFLFLGSIWGGRESEYAKGKRR
jgi:hypothetical protein